MSITTGLTAADIITLLAYNKENGEFRWLPRELVAGKSPKMIAEWNRRNAGNLVCTKIDHYGYATISLYRKRYTAHRIAWAIIHERWPEGEIDHINGVKSDNRYANLRCVNRSESMRNMPIKRTNTSGANGVSMDKKTGKWRVNIRANGRLLHLGSFVSFADAVRARSLANMEHGYHPNHGRKP
jgi:hypothetical protein